MRRVFQRSVAPVAAAATTGFAARYAASDFGNVSDGVWSIIGANKMYSQDYLKEAMNEYYALGFDESYVNNYDDKAIAEHVMAYICAKSDVAEGKKLRFTRVSEMGGLFFSNSEHEEQLRAIKLLEETLRKNAPEFVGKTHGISVRSYHSHDGSCVLYVLEYSKFVDCEGLCAEVANMATERFVATRTKAVAERYHKLLEQLRGSIKPVYDLAQFEEGKILTCAFKDRREGDTFLDELSVLINRIPNTTITKKFMETFSNGSHIYSFYVKGGDDETLSRAANQIGLLPNRPNNAITQLYQDKVFDAMEVAFANALVIFSFYFTPPKTTEDFSQLRTKLAADQPSLSRLKNLRNELVQDVMSERFLGEIMFETSDIVKKLYQLFKEEDAEGLKQLEAEIFKKYEKDPILNVLQTWCLFNKVVVKTNFFKTDKAAIAFRLDPKFLGQYDWPRIPHGVFLFVGPIWRGFHIRFTDIARGGVRMILSNNRQAYVKNKQTLFQENYNLAYTQLLKNKDIPEGGSKGTILVSSRANYNKKTIFLQYVDAMLDVILPGEKQVRDNLGQEEIIFLGPDENTAGDFPKFGALYSKERGYSWWKSFTTGKDPILGGIPHDTYGMTSESVRVNVMGVYEKLGLRQESLSKLQTGGPDGDLGSNEILLSGEKYHAIVDGSGVLYDPNGLNRRELTRLARTRSTVDQFDDSKLSRNGFFVPAKKNISVRLPNGTTVNDGVDFRNGFHFNDYLKCDVFVPCGGRPRSVTLSNVHQFLVGVDATGEDMLSGRLGDLSKAGKTRYKIIVEGANLFISQDARLALEAVGVVVIKDAAANKGGVTSSSIEVLTGLAMTDAEHKELMGAKDAENAPKFYKRMVDEIIEKIQANARREFEAIWRERELHPDQPTTIAIDELSKKIVDIRGFVYASNLFEDKAFVRHVLKNYVPTTLLQQVPLDTFMERVPANYQRAIFSIYIASDYVYTVGPRGSEFDFYSYMQKHREAAAAEAAEAAAAEAPKE